MTKLPVKITDFPDQVDQSGLLTIQEVKDPQETRFGLALILIVTNPKGEQRSLFVPYSTEISSRTNLARLLKAFSDDTTRWIGRKINVAISEDGKRTIEPVVK